MLSLLLLRVILLSAQVTTGAEGALAFWDAPPTRSSRLLLRSAKSPFHQQPESGRPPLSSQQQQQQGGGGPALVTLDRRQAWRTGWTTLVAAVVVTTASPSTAHAAATEDGSSANGGVIRSKGCYQGQGEACQELADENALIQSLQVKSAANRDRNEREALNAYYRKNYPDFFATMSKVMIQKPDGSYMLVTDSEAEALQLAGKVKSVRPTTKGGTMTDLTQRPILVLISEE